MREVRKDRKITRRHLLKGALVIGAVAAVQGLSPKYSVQAEEPTSDAPQTDLQYGFWVDTAKCDNCRKCIDICRQYNNTPEDVDARRKVSEYRNADSEKVYITTSCMHCAVPSCESVCPARAIFKRTDGIVDIDPGRCIGCKYCFQACPFGVPHYTSEAMDKCDCCLANGIKAGGDPRCVQECPTGALNYGTIAELAAMSNGRAKAIVASTGPSYFLS
jgi:Fe-S-cluster-containing dehydrogenase component